MCKSCKEQLEGMTPAIKGFVADMEKRMPDLIKLFSEISEQHNYANNREAGFDEVTGGVCFAPFVVGFMVEQIKEASPDLVAQHIQTFIAGGNLGSLYRGSREEGAC